MPRDRDFFAYRKAIENHINTNPIYLLRRYLPVSVNAEDAYNVQQAMSSEFSHIRPIRCLESLLLDFQISSNPNMLNAPTEFFSLYLKNAQGQLRVYYLTDGLNGLRKIGSLMANVANDLHHGWQLIGNLHNHSFWLKNLGIDEGHHPQGVLAPSANDIFLFQNMRRKFGLESASITNGFDTIEIPAAAFTHFHVPK